MSQFVVFFRDGRDSISAKDFIAAQTADVRVALEDAVHQLSTTGRIEGHRSGLLTNGDWSIWLEDAQGERSNFVLHTSRLQSPESSMASSAKTQAAQSTAKKLVVVDPGGERDSVGGFHPGYWSTDAYASRLSISQKESFLKAVSLLKPTSGDIPLPQFNCVLRWI